MQESNDSKTLAETLFDDLYHNQIKGQIDSDPEKFQNLKIMKIGELKIPETTFLEKRSLDFLQSIHSMEVYAKIFLESTISLLEQKAQSQFIVFEKDDPLCIKFVTAAANLRCHIFHLAFQNEFSVKEIAGNIVPAICSTNSIVASIQITEALKYLKSNNEKGGTPANKELYVQNDIKSKVLSVTSMKPNPSCQACGRSMIKILVYINMDTFTIGDFLREVVDKNNRLSSLSMTHGEMITYERGDYLDEEEAEENEEKLKKTFFKAFKSKKDLHLTITSDESNVLTRYLIVNDPSQANFHIENEDLSDHNNLNEIMKMNHIDYDDEEIKKKQALTETLQKQSLIEIDDDECENENMKQFDSNMENLNGSTSKKRSRNLENEEKFLEEYRGKELKQNK